MNTPITMTWDKAGKSYDLKDANGKLLGLIFEESDARMVCEAVNQCSESSNPNPTKQDEHDPCKQ